MTPSMKYFTGPILLGAAVALSGCAGSGGDDDKGKGGPGVPANAITITAANAEATVKSATATKDLVPTFGEPTPAVNLTLKGSLDLAKKIRQSSNSGPATATGVTLTENCPGGGTITGSFTESGNTDSGSITFNKCVDEGFTLSGTLDFSETLDPSTTVYSVTASGNLSATGNGTTVNFNGFDFAENGNLNNMTYTITKFTYAFDVTTNGSSGGGFLVELTAPIVESTGDFCPESGAIKITGANSTTAELIYNGNGTVTIKANGTVVNAAAACI